MDKGYYKPNINEFHKGFKFEITKAYNVVALKTHYLAQFTPVVYNGSDSLTNISTYINAGLIRVKYLDMKDILSMEVFDFFDYIEADSDTPHAFNLFITGAGDEETHLLLFDNNGMTIPYLTIKNHTGILFTGFIKNINELHRLLHQLNIINGSKRVLQYSK